MKLNSEAAKQAFEKLIADDTENQHCGLRHAYSQIINDTPIWQLAQSNSPFPEYAESIDNYALCALIKYGAQGISVAHHYADCLGGAYAIYPTDTLINTTTPESRLALFMTIPYFTSPTEVKYLNPKGKTTSAKIGKALAKILPALSEKERHQLADLLKREFAPKPPAKFLLAPANNPDLWKKIYQEAADEYNLTSCMTNYEGIRAIQGYACAHLLPEERREEQMNFALAYIVDEDGIPYARAIVNTKSKEFISTYSARVGEMEKSLHAAGYRHNEQALDGMYIYAGDEGEYAPYVDGHHEADEVYFANKRFWKINSYGDYTLDTTTGYAPDTGEQCECCGDIAREVTAVRDYVRFTDNFVESYVCEGCRGNNFTFVPSEGEYYPDDFIATDNRGETIILHHHFLDNHIAIGDSWYHIDDVVFSEFHDEYIPEDEAIYVDFLEDNIWLSDLTLSSREEDGFWDFHYAGLNNLAIENNCHISQIQE